MALIARDWFLSRIPEEVSVLASTVWRVLYWVLAAGFMVAAALNMAGTAAGFGTNHLADLVVPAWLYITLRGLTGLRRRNRVNAFLGATPERAAVILFVASSATEVAQIYWPTGLFSGRFDPLDIVAFGLGILPLYLIDRTFGATVRDQAVSRGATWQGIASCGPGTESKREGGERMAAKNVGLTTNKELLLSRASVEGPGLGLHLATGRRYCSRAAEFQSR